MHKTAIVFDLDNVTYPFQEAWSLIAVSKGLITPAQAQLFPESWYFYRELGMSGEEFAATLTDWIPDGLSDMLPPYPDVAKAWRDMDRAGIDIYAVTARPVEATAVTREWLDRHALRYSELHVVQGTKVPYLPLDEGYERIFAIDDNAVTIREYAEVSKEFPEVRSLQMYRQWNRAMGLRFDVTTIRHGEDLYHHVMYDITRRKMGMDD